jgi:uncharacterized MAPEG superfamily protein
MRMETSTGSGGHGVASGPEHTLPGIDMSTDLLYLALSIGLGVAQIVAASHTASRVRGYAWSASARDTVLSPLEGVAGRLARAVTNYGETFPFFVAAVLLAHQTRRVGATVDVGAALYFWARVAYVILYALGVPIVRSLAWNTAILGIAMVLWGALA